MDEKNVEENDQVVNTRNLFDYVTSREDDGFDDEEAEGNYNSSDDNIEIYNNTFEETSEDIINEEDKMDEDINLTLK